MKWKPLYLIAAVLGTILPYSFFLPFLLENGLNIGLLVEQLMANRISAFFGMDVIVSAFALIIFVFHEGMRLQMKHLWLYVLATLTVGVSLGLPLFLYMRERHLERNAANP